MTTFSSIEVPNFNLTGLDIWRLAKATRSANVKNLPRKVQVALVKRLIGRLNKILQYTESEENGYNGDTDGAFEAFQMDLNEMLPCQIEFAIRDLKV